MTVEHRAGASRTDDWLLVSWAVVITLLLIAPPSLLPGLDRAGATGLDKVGHFVLFLVLAWLAVEPARARTRHPLLAAVVASVLFGAALEGVQALLGWRSAEVLDVVADGIGSWAGVLPAFWRRA